MQAVNFQSDHENISTGNGHSRTPGPYPTPMVTGCIRLKLNTVTHVCKEVDYKLQKRGEREKPWLSADLNPSLLNPGRTLFFFTSHWLSSVRARFLPHTTPPQMCDSDDALPQSSSPPN